MKQIYLDNAATTRVDSSVVKAMLPYYIKKFGNASSIHSMGEEAKKAIEESREIIAKSIGAKNNEIIFTSGGTESNNLAIKGLFFSNYPKKNHIITSKIEHECVLNSCKWLKKQGAKVSYLNVDEKGFVNPEDIEKEITDKTFLVTIIHGQNEIGTIQNLGEIGKICRENGIYFHSDACQSYTKTNLNVNKNNLDLMTLNAHKIHGPKGVGVLYIREGIKITPLAHGGGHEYKLRSGTENVPGIVGFAKSVKIAKSEDVKKMNKMRDEIIKEILKIPNTRLNGAEGEKRLCNNINVSFKNIEGESIASYLNSRKIFISTGSACSSHKLESSHVLLALGMSHLEANSSIRITISKFTTEKEIKYFLGELKKCVEKLRKISPFAN